MTSPRKLAEDGVLSELKRLREQNLREKMHLLDEVEECAQALDRKHQAVHTCHLRIEVLSRFIEQLDENFD